MLRFIDVLVGDCSGLIKYALLSVLLFGGAISCISIASLIAHYAILRPEEGFTSFLTIMSFSGSGLVEPVRQSVEVINWFGLLAIGSVIVRSSMIYFKSVAKRAARPSNVVQFPTSPSDDSPFVPANVANG